MHSLKTMRITLLSAIALLSLAVFSTGCKSTPEQEAKDQGVEILFEEYLHDYGEIEEGSDGIWSFEFKNTGEKAIVINRVRSTCGCTIPDWNREPIEPGEESEIKVKYNTAQTGTFFKSVVVYSTAINSPVKLQIKGKVFPKETKDN